MRNGIVTCAALVCAALALVIAGCGGGDSSTTSTSASVSGATGVSGAALTKEQFIQQADAICKSSNDELDQAAQQVFGGQKPSNAELTQFINDRMLPSLESEISGISALTPPAGDEDEVQALLDAVNAALDKVQANPQLVLVSDNSGPFSEANQLAQAYGLKVCGQG